MADDQKTLPQGTRDQAALTAFVEQLIRDKNDPEIKSENISRLAEVLLGELNDQINSHLINILPEDKQKELEGLLDKDAEDSEVDAFFGKNIPNLEAEIAAVLLNFRAGFLATAVNVSKSQPVQAPKSESSESQNASKVDDDLTAAPPAPADHSPIEASQISSDKIPNVDKAWN